MKQHCKGCKFHHDAGHKTEDKKLLKYNDHCCKTGMQAAKSIGHCKLNNLKEIK